jgi:hypothetical protein
MTGGVCGKMKKSKFYLITVGLLLLVFVAVASVSAATITLTSPNGGESWQRGTTHTVTWSYTDFPAGAPVKIVLLKAGAEVGTIITSTSIGIGGTGHYTWDINPSGATGSEYKVKISGVNQPTVSDTSNNYFTLSPAGTAPTITVTSPNGGESWQRGTTHTVSWSYTGTPGSTVKITLLDAGAEVGSIISSYSIGSGGTGSYSWAIGSSGLTGSNFKVKVQSISQPTISDTSNNVFTLTPAGSGGAKVYFGEPQTIEIDLSAYHYETTATTDGFVTFYCNNVDSVGVNIAGKIEGEGIVGGNYAPIPPYTWASGSFTMPVRKGETWEVAWQNCNNYHNLRWLPLSV